MSVSLIVTGCGGRMGSTIIRLIEEAQGMHMVATVDRHDAPIQGIKPSHHNLEDALKEHPHALVLDFTSPQASLTHAALAAEYGNAIVVGTTGFTPEELNQLRRFAEKTPLFWTPNMSVGVNVLLKLLPDFTRSLGKNYDAELMEIHHKHKKDAPSGTALYLAQAVAEGKNWNLPDVACYHREGITGARPEEQIGLQTLRGGDVVGVHTIYYMGPGERLELTHQAHSRENFANGAIRAAFWLHGRKPGKMYSMQDVLADQGAEQAPAFFPDKALQVCADAISNLVKQSSFSGVTLGISGGLDSALVAALAVDALGAEKVLGLIMPSPYNPQQSIDDAKALANNLGIKCITAPISPMLAEFESQFDAAIKDLPAKGNAALAKENMQPRIRATLLMSLSQHCNLLVLNASNKSEAAMGYCTLYGDTVGALAPLGDVYKTQVYEMARSYNAKQGKETIPANILEKAPSAELHPNQKDSDTLPPYEQLDPIIQGLLAHDLDVEKALPDLKNSLPELSPAEVEKLALHVATTMTKMSYKTKQCPPVVAINPWPLGEK